MATSAQQRFELSYQLPITLWGDRRIPPELKGLAESAGQAGTALELGCGTGTFSIFLAQQGYTVTGVDFAPTAIRKAEARAASAGVSAEFLVGDVTRLDHVDRQFDIALDIGCFHCLDAAQQRSYASELARLTRHGSTLLIWGMNSPPPEGRDSLSPMIVEEVFAADFGLARVEASRRRLVGSKWYWLVRR
jgi:SAM-dependent methyltransferase